MRDVSHSENMRNRTPFGEKGKARLIRESAPPARRLPKGVAAHGLKFKAQIVRNGKNIYLGLYATKEEASAAFETARLSVPRYIT